MSGKVKGDKLTGGDKLAAALLRVGPLLAFLFCALPLFVYFLFRYFTVGEGAGEYMIFALTSLAVGSFFGLFAALLVFLYRKYWEKGLRRRLAEGGIRAEHLDWFMSEVPVAKRRTLKRMQAQSPLLADAYRETLAARVTAAHVLRRARREKVAVERRILRAATLPPSKRAELERDLKADRERLARVEREASGHSSEIEARLQTIEAIAGRNASEAQTELALRRLGSVSEHVPLGLESARLEREVRDEVEKELRELPPPQTRER